MKLRMQLPTDNVMHSYCIDCQQETVTMIGDDMYHCATCSALHPRAIIIDPQVTWRVDSTGEYIHETAGIVVVDESGKVLLFDRTRFPAGLTFPAGHVDKDESPLSAAQRELREETGLVVSSPDLKHVASDPLIGDSCRRGSDMHIWHSFIVRMPVGQVVTVDAAEGKSATWMTREEAQQSALTFATRQVLTRHWHKLAVP